MAARYSATRSLLHEFFKALGTHSSIPSDAEGIEAGLEFIINSTVHVNESELRILMMTHAHNTYNKH
jgi:hypothetical protein